MGAHVLRKLPPDLRDGELGCRDDRGNVDAVAFGFRPAHCKPAARTFAFDLNVRVVGESDPRRLKDRRRRRTDDVFAGISPAGVTLGKNRGQPIAAVPAKRHRDHRTKPGA